MPVARAPPPNRARCHHHAVQRLGAQPRPRQLGRLRNAGGRLRRPARRRRRGGHHGDGGDEVEDVLLLGSVRCPHVPFVVRYYCVGGLMTPRTIGFMNFWIFKEMACSGVMRGILMGSPGGSSHGSCRGISWDCRNIMGIRERSPPEVARTPQGDALVS